MAKTDIRIINSLPEHFEHRDAVQSATEEALRSLSGGRWLIEIRPAYRKHRVKLEVTPPGKTAAASVTITTWESAKAILEKLRAAGVVAAD